MNNWLQYLIEANIYLSVFYLVYYWFLQRETHYLMNRVYLLASCVLAFIIPLLQIGALRVAQPVVRQQVAAVEVHIVKTSLALQKLSPDTVQAFSWQNGLVYVYLLGCAITFIILAVKLFKLFKLTLSNKRKGQDGYQLVYIDQQTAAFSFFNYLFIGKNISSMDIIIRHEVVHIRQRHSLDILLLELIKIVSWFNPLVYLVQNSLKTVHEYIADEQTLTGETDAFFYSSFLVDTAYGLNGPAIGNSFFNYNLLKKRILMLNQQRSGKLAKLKFLIVLPLSGVLLCTSTLAFSKTYGWIDLVPRYQLSPAKQVTPSPVNKSTGLSVIASKDVASSAAIKKTMKPAVKKSLNTNIQSVDTPNLIPASTVHGDELIREPAIDTPKKNAFNDLYQSLSRAIMYPAVDRENNVNGKVFASFIVDADHNIQQIEILRTPSNYLSAEVIKSLKACKPLADAKTGITYIIVVNFNLSSYNGPAQGNRF